MKKNCFFAFLLSSILIANSVSGQYRYLASGYNSEGLPTNLLTPDTISAGLLTRIHTSLPELVSVPACFPQYLADSVPTVLHLRDSCELFLTYIGQGGWYENVLGFYTFPWGHQPDSIRDTNFLIIFPNCAMPGRGGALTAGSRVSLGKFSANTGIGFVCIGNGWSGGSVTPGYETYYSDSRLNPEPDSLHRRHITALYDSTSKLIIWGFEDRFRNFSDTAWIHGGSSDQDFNDVLFYVRACHDSSFDHTGFPPTINPGDSVGTGSGGGLESSNLGGLVSKRDYNRIKNSIDKKIDYKNTPLFTREPTVNEKTSSISSALRRLVPSSLDSNSTIPVITTPTDIPQLTIAKDVLAVDYISNQQAKAVVLAIETLNKPYNHTKSICDRFRGATVVNVDTIAIQNYKFIKFTVLQPDGNTEYSITFDAGKSETSNTFHLQSKWLISQYSGDDSIFSFQVWANTPASVIKLTNSILNNLKAILPIQQIDTNFSLPKAYIAHGQRNKSNLNISVTNNTTISNAYLLLEENKNELSALDTLYVPLTLTNGKLNNTSIVINDGYQYEGHLYLDSVLVDDVYMADGNWAVDYAHTTTTLSYQTINEPTRIYADNEYPLYRNIDVRANGTEDISVYKFITSGSEPINFSNYHSFKFFAGCNGFGSVEIKLIKDGIVNYANQYKTTIPLTQAGNSFSISFDEFASDSLQTPFQPNDLTAVVYTFHYNGTQTDMHFFASDLAISEDVVLSTKIDESKSLYITPNPNNGVFNCRFGSDANRDLQLKITDVTGRIVYQKDVQATIGVNNINISLSAKELSKISMLIVSLGNKDMKYSNVKITLTN